MSKPPSKTQDLRQGFRPTLATNEKWFLPFNVRDIDPNRSNINRHKWLHEFGREIEKKGDPIICKTNPFWEVAKCDRRVLRPAASR